LGTASRAANVVQGVENALNLVDAVQNDDPARAALSALGMVGNVMQATARGPRSGPQRIAPDEGTGGPAAFPSATTPVGAAGAANVGAQPGGTYSFNIGNQVPPGYVGPPAQTISPGVSQMHHPIPVFMGGNPGAGQYTQYLSPGIHSDFHNALNDNLAANGLPRGSGPRNSYGAWRLFFAQNPGSQQRAFNILRSTAGTFDMRYGTNFLDFVDFNLSRGNFTPR
jgi:hypothetical protein